MRATILAPVGGDAGVVEVDINVGSTTSAAELLSELMKANLISGVVCAYFYVQLGSPGCPVPSATAVP